MNDTKSTGGGLSSRGKAIFLGLLVLLFLSNLSWLVWFGNYRWNKYGNLVISLLLLFNHIAFNYTKTGRLSKVMKTIAVVWLGVVVVYLLCLFRWGISG